jgi:ATP-dependent DNA ligase
MCRLDLSFAVLDGVRFIRFLAVDFRETSDGFFNFDKLHSRGYDHQLVLCAFDLLELNGERLAPTARLRARKKNSKKLLVRTTGLRLSEQSGDDTIIFNRS